MNNKPEQQTIPGLPKPDRRGMLRIEIDVQKRAAESAKREMKKSAIELAEYMAGNMGPNGKGLIFQPISRMVSEYRKAQKDFITATVAAGDAAMDLRREEHRILEERANEENTDEEGGEE